MEYDFLTHSMLKKSVRGQVFATTSSTKALQSYRVFELGFPRSDSIEYHLGYINPEFSKTYESSLALDNTRMNWVITDQQRYNVAMITFDKSPIQSITNEGTSFIPLTLQTSNFIAVQAYLTLTLNTGGLWRENNTGKTAGSGN